MSYTTPFIYTDINLKITLTDSIDFIHFWLDLLHYREVCLLHYQLKNYYIIG